jgi:hypothetical protein
MSDGASGRLGELRAMMLVNLVWVQPDRSPFYEGATAMVTTQRCLPIFRSRANPSFS